MGRPGKKIAFYTLGCKLNQFETELIADSFIKSGGEICAIDEPADIFIINTCTVTSKSDQKARRMIRLLSSNNLDSLVIVTGCYAQLDPDALKNLGPNIQVVSQTEKDILVKNAEAILESRDFPLNPDPVAAGFTDRNYDLLHTGYVFHSRPYLKIQDGCDNFCAYCRVPLARGASKSADPESVIKNIKEIEAAGYSEAVLTGVNISSYSSSSSSRNYSLTDLVKQIFACTDRIRIRLSSVEPDSINRDYASILENERLCPHFHLPVQSGSDRILKSMGRKYLSSKVLEAADILRSSGRDPLIAADFITGFPGEEERDFEDTVKLVKDTGFASLHVFPFSRRKGTKAFEMKNRIPERVSRQRADKLRQLSRLLFDQYASRWTGRQVNAVLEEKTSDTMGDYWQGITENYLKVKISFQNQPDCSKTEALKAGKLVKCRIGEQQADGANSFTADFFDDSY